MRTITTAQRNQIAAGTLAVFSKLELQNPDLVWTDVSVALSTPDWFNEATLTESIDQLSQSFTAVLLRDTGSLSLAPLRTDSTINRNGVNAYAPMLDVKRMWRVSVAVIAQGTTPVTADWKEIGKGYIDTIDTQGSPSTITVTGRDLLAQLLDHYMRGVDGVLPFAPYSTSGTDALELVIQQILDDELGTGRANVGSSGITLYTPVSPVYLLPQFQTGSGPLMDLLTKMAQKAGMVLRYRYDASDVLRLTLLKPPRTASVADWTIGPAEYSVIPINKLDITGVRTLIDLFYIDSSLGQQHVTSPAALTGTLACTAGAATFSVSQAGVVANGSLILVAGNTCIVSAFNGTTGCTLSGTPTFTASPWTTSAALTKYGVRYMKIDLSGSLPMTAVNAQAMDDAIRSDLENPWLEQQLTSYGLWFAQPYDYAKTLANGVQYNADQLGGVTTITHRLKGGTVKTDIGARGQPSGGYRLWMATGLTPPDAATLNVVVTPGNPNYSITWSGTGVMLSIDGATPVLPSASPITVARNAPGGADKVYTFSGTSNGKTISNTVTIPAQSGSTAPSASLVPSLTNNQVDDTTSPVTVTATASNLPATYTWVLSSGFSKGHYSGTFASGSNSVNPLSGAGYGFNVNPGAKNSVWYRLRVTVGADNYDAECQVQGLKSFLNQSGAPVAGTAWSDGGGVARTSDPTGNSLTAGITDNAARNINKFFAKPLSGNPDDLSSVPNDTVGGHYAVLAIDANRRPITDFASAHLNKTADNIGDGATHQLAGGARGFTGLDGSGNLQTAVLGTALVGDQPAAHVARQGGRTFQEVFDAVPSAASGWSVGGNAPIVVANAGSTQGANILRVVGYGSYSGIKLAFNPNKLYRVRARVRTSVANTAGASVWYLGFYAKDATGTPTNSNSGTSYVCTSGTVPTLGVWTEYIGWVKGATIPYASGGPGSSTNASSPSPLNVNTVTIEPLIYAGYNGTGGTFEVDYFLVDEFDEDASFRTYTMSDPNGNINPGVTDSASRAVRNFFGKALPGNPDTLDSAPDGTTYARTLGSRVSSGKPFIDFSEAIHLNKTADNIGDGATHQLAGGARGYTGLTSSGRLQTGVEPGADISGIDTAGNVAGRMGAFFAAVFAVAPNTTTGWLVPQGSWSVVTAVAADGTMGTSFARALGVARLQWQTQIPINPKKLYRLRVRTRNTVANTVGTSTAYLGVNQTDVSGAATNSGGGRGYVVLEGVTPSVGVWTEYVGWIKGASQLYATTTLGTSAIATAPIALNANTVAIAPYLILGYSGSGGTFDLDYFLVDEYDEDASFRTYTMSDPSGNINSSVQQTNGSSLRNPASGHQSFSGLVHGQSLPSFNGGAYANPPAHRLTGGASYEPASVWATSDPGTLGPATFGVLAPSSSRQIMEVSVINPTASTGTVRARLRQAGTSTARTDHFTGDPPGTAITTVGGATSVTSANAPSFDDHYTASFDYDFESSGGTTASSIRVVVSLDYWTGSAWSTLATQTFSASDPGEGNGGTGTAVASGTGAAIVGVVSGRITTSTFRLTIQSASHTGVGPTYSLTPHTLTYSTAAGDQYASMTPIAGITLTNDLIGSI